MHDLVDGERRRRPLRMRAVMGRQFLADLMKPLVELAERPRVQAGKGADHTRLALGDDQFRPRDEEQWRPHHRYAKRFADTMWQCHARPFKTEFWIDVDDGGEARGISRPG